MINNRIFSPQARHYMKCLWNCVQFWLCCTVTLSFAQAISAILLLPPLLSVNQIVWLSCLIIPVLSISMIATPMDSTIMQRATGKNQCIINGQVIIRLYFNFISFQVLNKLIFFYLQVAIFVLWCYGSKFLPTIVTVVLSQYISFLVLCPMYVTTDSKCVYIYPDLHGKDIWGGWGSKPNVMLAIQHFALAILVLHYGIYHDIYIFIYSM